MLLAAGYAIISIDVRGTGASFGQWRHPWHFEERLDALEVVDWIINQPWCNGNVCMYGISYDCNAALFALAEHGRRMVTGGDGDGGGRNHHGGGEVHEGRGRVEGVQQVVQPIKAVAALYPFVDLFRDVAAPGVVLV